MTIVKKEMNLEKLREATEELVREGLIYDGLIVKNFYFEVPKVVEELFEKDIYAISFHVNLPLNYQDKLAFFLVSYSKEPKSLMKKSEIVDIKKLPCYAINKKVLEIIVSLKPTDNLPDLIEPIEKYNYQEFFKLAYYTNLNGGTFSMYIEDFLIDFAYYGKVL